MSSAALAVVEKFCKYHLENPNTHSNIPADYKGIINHFKEFDGSFSTEIAANPDLLFETISAADFLNESNLLDVLCRTAALLLKNVPIEDVKKRLRLFLNHIYCYHSFFAYIHVVVSFFFNVQAFPMFRKLLIRKI